MGHIQLGAIFLAFEIILIDALTKLMEVEYDELQKNSISLS
jgi:hypothetical protein